MSSHEQEGSHEHPVEIERKFVVWPKALPPELAQQAQKQEDISQGYMVIGSDGSEARLRDRADVFTLTVKSKGSLSRGEWETEINREQFETLWPTTAGKRIEKTRYSIPYLGHLIELDIYKGPLVGLATAEVEFEDEDQAVAFEAPDWFRQDVTDDPVFKNQLLALNGIPRLVTGWYNLDAVARKHYWTPNELQLQAEQFGQGAVQATVELTE